MRSFEGEKKKSRVWIMKAPLALILLVAAGASAQMAKSTPSNSSKPMVWQIPSASIGNTISLAIQNNSSLEAKMVSVRFTNVPAWLEFKSSTVLLKNIPAETSGDAEFVFCVDKKAPIGQDTTLTAVISTSDGQRWTKEMTVSVVAPKDYVLYDNFPNPFNPSTKIAFELPKASHVRIIIYDLLGREVAEIADGNYPAGYSELTWNGINRNGLQVSSGIYFYRISTDGWAAVKKMVLLR